MVRIKASKHTRNLDEKYVDTKDHKKLSTLYTLLEKEIVIFPLFSVRLKTLQDGWLTN